MWLHRFLTQAGVHNLVVDSSSIEVNRRARRTTPALAGGARETDRLDGSKLLSMLIRYASGEKKVWHVVHVPTAEQEDDRQLHRELETLKQERTRHISRIKAFLASCGLHLKVSSNFLQQLSSARLWDGSCIPPALQARLRREWGRLQVVEDQVRELEADRAQLLRTSTSPSVQMARQLMHLKGIGEYSAWLYTMEFFAWRRFRNPKELGALAGLTPTPSQSGDSSRELGLNKAGNRHIRATPALRRTQCGACVAIEIAWNWLHFQPHSQLSCWYQKRFGSGSSRVRRIGIVALARKVLIALWRYLELGIIPQGASLKA
jgi:transposase